MSDRHDIRERFPCPVVARGRVVLVGALVACSGHGATVALLVAIGCAPVPPPKLLRTEHRTVGQLIDAVVESVERRDLEVDLRVTVERQEVCETVEVWQVDTQVEERREARRLRRAIVHGVDTQVEERLVGRGRCGGAPLTGSRVALVGSDQSVIAERELDETGTAEFSVSPEAIVRHGPDFSLAVDGAHVSDTDALHEVFVTSRETLREINEREGRQRLAELLDREIAEGQCDEDSTQALESALHYTRNTLGAIARDYVFDLTSHDAIVATPSGTEMSFAPGLRGEYHVFAIGRAPVALDAARHDRQEVTAGSQYEGVLRLPYSASRVLL